MTIIEQRRQELFADDALAEDKNDTAAKEKRPASPLTLDKLQAVTVHYDLFSRLQALSAEKNIDYLIFRRVREGRYAPKNKYYFSILAVKAGTLKAHHVKEQANIVAGIYFFSPQVCHRRSSKSYKSLQEFLKEISALELENE